MSEITEEYVAQYIPYGGYGYTDLNKHTSEADADKAISENILSWQVNQFRTGDTVGRPSKYRIIKRVITEQVMSEREDDGSSLQSRLK